LAYGGSPQEARSVLPNSLKTEIVMTANLREWRHFFFFFPLGITGKPHPQMLELTIPLLKEFAELNSVIFGDLADALEGKA
jgi:thymidylate synthase (FAD)